MDTTVSHIVDKLQHAQTSRRDARGHDDEGLHEGHKSRRTQTPIPPDLDARWLDELVECVRRGPDAVTDRLECLEHEWDAERLLHLHTSTLALCGVALSAATGKRRWLLVPAVMLPLSIADGLLGSRRMGKLWNRLGLRTRAEVDRERLALRMLRGDFDLRAAPRDLRGRTVYALRAATPR
jgi:hypothetical protein